MARTAFRELAEIVRLKKGSHKSPGDGVCTMELVAWMAGEKHSDNPACVSPVIAAFVPSFNDALDSAHRQRLAAVAARLIDTRGSSEQELLRRRLVWDWMIATAVPTWLAAAQRLDLADRVVAGRAAVLDAVTQAIDAHGHVRVRPVNDHRTAAAVGRALAAADDLRGAGESAALTDQRGPNGAIHRQGGSDLGPHGEMGTLSASFSRPRATLRGLARSFRSSSGS